MWFIIALTLLFALSLGGGGWGHARGAYWTWSPAVLIVLAATVLYFTGHLAFHA